MSIWHAVGHAIFGRLLWVQFSFCFCFWALHTMTHLFPFTVNIYANEFCVAVAVRQWLSPWHYADETIRCNYCIVYYYYWNAYYLEWAFLLFREIFVFQFVRLTLVCVHFIWACLLFLLHGNGFFVWTCKFTQSHTHTASVPVFAEQSFSFNLSPTILQFNLFLFVECAQHERWTVGRQ